MHYTRLNRLPRDKRSNLLGSFSSYEDVQPLTSIVYIKNFPTPIKYFLTNQLKRALKELHSCGLLSLANNRLACESLSVTPLWCNKPHIIFTFKHLHPSLTFASKANVVYTRNKLCNIDRSGFSALFTSFQRLRKTERGGGRGGGVLGRDQIVCP